MSAEEYMEDDNPATGASVADSLVADDVGEDLIDESTDVVDEKVAESSPEEVAGETAEEEPVSEPTVEDQLADLQKALQESDDRLKRLSADFENFRRRTAKEKLEVGDVVTQNILTDMLPLLNNFERAIGTENNDAEGFRKGVEMIFTQFQETLKKHGLEAIDTKDAKFDPNFHQAVMRVENSELEDDTIAAELAKGYIVKGRVIRPSMVQVVANG